MINSWEVLATSQSGEPHKKNVLNHFLGAGGHLPNRKTIRKTWLKIVSWELVNTSQTAKPLEKRCF